MRLLGTRHDALSHPRHQMSLLMKESVGFGLMSDEQSAIAERVLDLNERTVGDEMVPWDKVIRVNADDPPGVLWDLANRTSVSRFPVMEFGPGGTRVLGVVNLYEALLHTRETSPPIRAMIKPALVLDRATPLRPALTRLKTGGEPLAIVTDRGRPVGLVTIKDLIEPITGELVTW
jgi:CBS domain containing-hemolysin-like protein